MKLSCKGARSAMLFATLALAGCGADTVVDELASAYALSELEPAAAPVDKSGDHLVRFALVHVQNDRLVGTFARQQGISVPNGYDSVWAGPHPETGDLVYWAGNASDGGVVLVTAGPPGLKLNISTDTHRVFAGELGSLGSYRLERGIYR